MIQHPRADLLLMRAALQICEHSTAHILMKRVTYLPDGHLGVQLDTKDGIDDLGVFIRRLTAFRERPDPSKITDRHLSFPSFTITISTSNTP